MLHIIQKLMRQGFQNAKVYEELSYKLKVIGKQKG